MVSLPELDSEIGVLRFLKWKTRLLALDVIRASGRAYINSIDDVQEPESNDPEVSTNLEQQDDAAVVRLALSKLNPRHREVLIASMYEEKSTEQIAAQVGLSENATRQLIFRARAAFKKALIGDVDTTGMSAAAILSVAARKAASEGKKVGAAALTLIALAVMSLTVFPGLNRATTDQMAERPVNPGNSQASEQAESPSPSATSEAAGPVDDSIEQEAERISAGSKASPSKESIEAVLDGPALGAIMNSDSRSKVFVLDQDYTAVGENGLTAKFTFNPTSDVVFSEVSAQIKLGEVVLDFAPTMPRLIEGKNADGLQTFIFEATVPSLFDESGQKWSDTVARNATFKLEVIMDRSGSKVGAISLAMLSNPSR